jgi:GT2 family glycosyltransferase
MATVTSKPAADAAIIIPHYNDVARLERCLGALMANDRTGAEIVVVDNGSTQSLDAVKRAFPEVRFLVETEKGAAAARNRGVAETEAPLLFFIDADCVAASDWTLTARRVAPLADLVGGRVDVFDETPPPRSGAEGFETVFAFNFRNYIEVQGFTGAGNLVTNRAVFDAVGGFRNGVSEDLEWSKRAVAMGYRLIYRDELVVSHPSRSDWATLRHKWHRMTRELYATNGSDPRGRLRWGLRALAMPVSALVHLPKVLMSPKLDGAGERGRAALTLIRLRLLRMGWMLRQVVGGSI